MLMKKGFLLLSLLFLVIGLAACSSNDPNTFNGKNWEKALKKTEKINVLLPVSGKLPTEITDQEQIEAFIKGLQIQTWEENEIPKGVIIEKICIFYKTENSEKKEVGRMITYKDIPYVDFMMNDIPFSFKVSDETLETLKSV